MCLWGGGGGGGGGGGEKAERGVKHNMNLISAISLILISFNILIKSNYI